MARLVERVALCHRLPESENLGDPETFTMPERGGDMKPRPFCVIAILVLLSVTTVFISAAEASEKLKAFASILPQKYFVERIGGDHVDVDVLVGPGHSPATYEPTPRQMVELSKARVFFRIGVPFEDALVPKIQSAFRDVLIVDSHKGIKLRQMDSESEHHETNESGESHKEVKDARGDHEEGTDGHHHDAGTPDPHIWLDPILMKTLGRNICEALSRIDPTNAPEYSKNLKGLQNDLDRVNSKITSALAPIKGKEIFVFHPAYGYFADRYGIRQVAVETGGKEPSAKQLTTLIDKAKHAGVKVIFVQPQFDTKYAESITKATGGAVVPLDPLALEYIKNLEEMAVKVESALSRQK